MGTRVFVGSYNLDPRSTWLNCEQGVLVENADAGRAARADLRAADRGSRAWHVTLEDGELRWSDGDETLDREPHASFSQKFQAWFARVFHLDAQL